MPKKVLYRRHFFFIKCHTTDPRLIEMTSVPVSLCGVVFMMTYIRDVLLCGKQGRKIGLDWILPIHGSSVKCNNLIFKGTHRTYLLYMCTNRHILVSYQSASRFSCSTFPIRAPSPSHFPLSSHHYLYRCPPSSLSFSC